MHQVKPFECNNNKVKYSLNVLFLKTFLLNSGYPDFQKLKEPRIKCAWELTVISCHCTNEVVVPSLYFILVVRVVLVAIYSSQLI